MDVWEDAFMRDYKATDRFLRKAMAQGQMPTKLALKVYYCSITYALTLTG